VVDGVAVIDEAADDDRIGEGDDDFQYARPRFGAWGQREGIPQAVLVLAHAIDLGDQECGLMNMEAVILLVRVDDHPFFGVAELTVWSTRSSS